MFSISSYRRLLCASVFLTSSHLTVFVFFLFSSISFGTRRANSPNSSCLVSAKTQSRSPLAAQFQAPSKCSSCGAISRRGDGYMAAEDRRWPAGGLFWINRKSVSCLSSHASQAPPAPTMRIRCVNLWLPVQLPAFKILLAYTPALFFGLQDHLLVKQWATCENNSDANLALNIFAWR